MMMTSLLWRFPHRVLFQEVEWLLLVVQHVFPAQLLSTLGLQGTG